MPKLILKFETTVLKEVPIGSQPVTIGRSPDNDIQIDNLAVSTQHAKVYAEEGHLVIEDLNSLNGTFLNNQRIQRAALKHGDAVLIGKHNLIVDDTWEAGPAPQPTEAQRKVAAPKVAETVVLDTKRRKELLEQVLAAQAAPAAGEPAKVQVAPPRVRVPSLMVLAGKTDQKEYLLSGKLTLIGKSEMATVRLMGFFVRLFGPEVAAQITKRDDGYYVGKGTGSPKRNGQLITAPTKLNDGDMIEVGSVKLNFVYRD